MTELEQYLANSHLDGGNIAFIEQLYESYLDDPSSVPEHWRDWFKRLASAGQVDLPHSPVIARFAELGKQGRARQASHTLDSAQAEKQAGVLRIINAYRVRGHQRAKLDPLGLSHRPEVPDLEPAFHSLNDADLAHRFNTGSLRADHEMALSDILQLLKGVYTKSIGAEYMHITDTNQRAWLQRRLETARGDFGFSPDDKRHLLEQLTAAEGLEKYLHTKYVGQKRFSLEGGDSLIPLLHGMIQRVGEQGVKEVVLGMAHRGRLNVLVNILGKAPKDLFDEFEGKKDVADNPYHSGDVKYHMGFSSEMDTPGGIVHVALGFNPSHLEIVNPVIAGSARARQTRRGDTAHTEVMPVLIHGDAAFAGQGVIMELFNMSQARGFQVGGTLHVIVNNQIGFTTSHPLDSRSTLYCTEVAKMVQAPILHVNGDDPEAVMFAMQIASDFRMEFRKDVVIDLVCYRRHGHNEADEPAATQPIMYQQIRSMKTTRELYADQLIEQGVLDTAGVQSMSDAYRDALDEGHPVAEIHEGPFKNPFTIDWTSHLSGSLDEAVDTTISSEQVHAYAQQLQQLPKGFKLHGRVQRIMDDRQKMASGELPMDWGFAETMAYASLLAQGQSLRLVGQDSGRGTFFHRHAVLHNQDAKASFTPLTTFVKPSSDEYQPTQSCTIIDSLLSEEAVLAFEYGYTSSDPETLVIWEGQFGDFVNGAQVVIDQFICSGEAKWERLSGLVMFLPHGYEGQGPEHSSARPERFMQLCAQNNMQVCVPTTPAQMFHMLRRQMLRKTRKPLVVMTPKSLLRNKASTSLLSQLSEGRFQNVIPDRFVRNPNLSERLLLCSGKVYYDLTAAREERGLDDLPIIRIEQLYPFPRPELIAELQRFPAAREIVWCQEEPMNQGAWYQIKHHLQACLNASHRLLYAGRPGSPSPAVGIFAKHVQEQKALVDDAVTIGRGIELVIE